MMASAALFLFGATVFVASWSYEIGHLRRMGPGYFPMLLGATLCTLAVLIALQEMKKRTSRDTRASRMAPSFAVLRPDWRPLLLPLLAILLFAALLETAGLVPAVIASVLTAGFAERSNVPVVVMGIAIVTAIFISVVFVQLIGIPFRLFAV